MLPTVHIEIEDVNDNSPEWQIFPTPVHVLEKSPIDTNVTQVYATDADSGEFGHVMYFLADEETSQLFAIDSDTVSTRK